MFNWVLYTLLEEHAPVNKMNMGMWNPIFNTAGDAKNKADQDTRMVK